MDRTYRKSETWRDFHADSGIIVDRNDYAYIMVVIAEDPTAEERIRKVAQAIDDLFDSSRPGQ